MRLALFLLLLSQSGWSGVELLSVNAGAVRLNLTSEPMRFVTKVIGEDKFFLPVSEEWTLGKSVGGPEILEGKTFVLIPNEATGIKVSFSQIRRTPLRKLSRPIAYTPYERLHADPKPVPLDPELYAMDLGETPITIEEDSFAGPDRVLALRVHPMRYFGKSQEWDRVISANVEISFESDGKQTAPVRAHASSHLAQYFALNAGFAFEKTQPVDLVIAHGTYQLYLQRYLDLKRDQGREVREHYLWDPTADAIKAIIKNEYASSVPPTQVLLVGNIDDLPSYRGSGDNTWTDFPYQNLDSGNVPDLSLGRLPVASLDELEAVLEKLIARELDAAKPKKVLLTAGVDTSLGCPANVTKVGDKTKAGNAATVLDKRYRLNNSTEQILAGYNENPNVVFYDGHGDRPGMLEVPLMIGNLDELKNQVAPLIFDIACLNANWKTQGAKPRNFAEMILVRPHSGAAGILASGGSGYGHDFFQEIGRRLAEARDQLGSDPSLNEVGKVILLAKIAGDTQDRTYWNYYGDPATHVW